MAKNNFASVYNKCTRAFARLPPRGRPLVRERRRRGRELRISRQVSAKRNRE